MDVQQALGNHGSPFQVKWKGRIYTLSYKVQRIKAELVRWAKETAINEVLQLRSLLPPEDYQQQLKSVVNDSRDGKYDYGGDILNEMLDTPSGRIANLRILLGKDCTLSDDELTELLLAEGDKISSFVGACAASIEQIKQDLGWDKEKDPNGENIDPKALAAALRAADLWE